MRDNNSSLDNLKKMLKDVQSTADVLLAQKNKHDEILEAALREVGKSDDPMKNDFIKDSEKIIKGVNTGDIVTSSAELQEYLNKYGKGVSKK